MCQTDKSPSTPPSPCQPHRDAVALAEVTRGGIVESLHHGHAVVADTSGALRLVLGDPDLAVFPRSAVKPFQALPLLESGAFDAYGLGPAELALACASHRGEPMHTDRVAAWLARIGCTVADLGCGSHLPTDEDSAAAVIRGGGPVTALYNNCSGKHTGFLTTARHLGEPVAGYTEPDHPVQRRVAAALGDLVGYDPWRQPWGIDGCAIPTFALPLAALARAMARYADPDGFAPQRAAAVRRITAAWAEHPELIGGSRSFDSLMMRALAGRVLIKHGAEGVACAVVPALGLGIALKVSDGAARGAEVALAALLHRFGAIAEPPPADVAVLAEPPVTDRLSRTVGVIRAAAPVREA